MPERIRVKDPQEQRRRSRFVRSLRHRQDAAQSGRDAKDNAVRLLKEIKDKRLDPHDLSRDQQKACLMVLANGRYTSPQLADILCVTAKKVRALIREVQREVGREVREWTLEEVIGQLWLAKEKCAAKAHEQEDPQLAWTVERDFARTLKELGALDAQPEGSVKITMEVMAANYQRARAAICGSLDPRLTGEVVDHESPLDLDARLPRPLQLDRSLPAPKMTFADDSPCATPKGDTSGPTPLPIPNSGSGSPDLVPPPIPNSGSPSSALASGSGSPDLASGSGSPDLASGSPTLASGRDPLDFSAPSSDV